MQKTFNNRRYTLQKSLLAVVFCISLGALLAMAGTSPARAANGADFNPGNIIDDGTFTNKNSMNIDAIQQFLNQKVPSCDTNGDKTIYDASRGDTVTRRVFSQRRGYDAPFTCLRDYNEGGKSAAQIIWEKSQDFAINPQVLIVLLQKEQALVTDDWPWPNQYRTATGYGCPDTAACDSQYYGFTNQLYQAARMFRLIMNGQGLNLYPPGVNSILYNPNRDCGSSQVTVQNRATSALYTYTPYQPNTAALNNLYGSGDGCSAYGNRNFWREFTDWFGKTSGDGFVRAKSSDPNDLRQWVIYRNIKQYIPSAEIIYAWGLQDTPLITYDAGSLNSIPTAPNLGRLMRVIDRPELYLLDGGKRYWIHSTDMLESWGMGGEAISSVSSSLGAIPQDGGALSYSVREADTQAIYMIAGTNGNGKPVLRAYPHPDMVRAWEGESPTVNVVSSSLFDRLNDAIDSPITTTKIIYNNAQYMVISRQKLHLSPAVSQLYTDTPMPILKGTFDRLISNGDASQFIRATDSPAIYVVDNNIKRPIASPPVAQAWSNNGNPPVNLVNPSWANLLPTGDLLSTYIGQSSSSGQRYLIDSRKMAISSGLQSAYGSTQSTTVSDALLATLPTAGDAALYLKTYNQPGVFLMENGVRRPFTNPTDFSMWTNGGNQKTEVSASVMNSFTQGNRIDAFIFDGSTQYLVDGGTKHTVTDTTKSAFGLSSPATVTSNTANQLATGSSLDLQQGKVGDRYYLFRNGVAWSTAQTPVAQAWNLTGTQTVSANLVNKTSAQGELQRFVQSSDESDKRIFVVDNGKLYHVTSPQLVWALGYNGATLTRLAPTEITSKLQATAFNGPLFKDGSGNFYVLDNSTKRGFASATVRNQWTGNGSVTVPVLSDTFKALLPDSPSVGVSIKGSGNAIYNVDAGNKRWIQSPTTYNTGFAPFTQTTDLLLDTLPTGDPIP